MKTFYHLTREPYRFRDNCLQPLHILPMYCIGISLFLFQVQRKLTIKGMETTSVEAHDTVSSLQVVENNLTWGLDIMKLMQEAKTQSTYKIATFISTYWFPILLPIGFFGNILSFLVMIKSNNRKMSTCIYMAALSINDSAMMAVAFHLWLMSVTSKVQPTSVSCWLTPYLSTVVLQNSTFQILAMTIDKYIAIKWPHKAALYSTPGRAKFILFGIFIFVAIYNIPHIVFEVVLNGRCYAYSIKHIAAKVHSWLSFVLNEVIPFSTLIYMNFVIVKTVRRSRTLFGNNDTITTTDCSTNKINKTMETKQQNSFKNVERQLTIMLLLVTTLFLILLIPTYIRFIYTSFVKATTPSRFAGHELFTRVSHNLYTTNSCINFFLYCISGKKFRNDLKEILCSNRNSVPSSRIDELQSNMTNISSLQ